MHLYNGTLLNNTKDKLLIHITIWIGIKVIMLSKKRQYPGRLDGTEEKACRLKKTISKDYILNDSIYVILSKRENHSD